MNQSLKQLYYEIYFSQQQYFNFYNPSNQINFILIDLICINAEMRLFIKYVFILLIIIFLSFQLSILANNIDRFKFWINKFTFKHKIYKN